MLLTSILIILMLSVLRFICVRGNFDLYALNVQRNISRGKFLTQFSVFPKEYEITFEVCLTSFPSGNNSTPLANIFNFNLNSKTDDLKYHIIGMWVNSKGELYFRAALNNSFIQKTFRSILPLGCNHYSISQLLFQQYRFALKISGENIYTTTNTGAMEFNDVKMHFSDPWYTEQPGYIRNVLVTKGCSELFILVEKTNILQNTIVGNISIFPKEYEISFQACLNTFSPGYSLSPISNMFYLNNGGDNSYLVGLWFTPNGELSVTAKLNGSYHSFKSEPFELGCRKYKISQTLYQGNYMFTVQVDGWTLLTFNNIAPLEFNNAQIYISSQFYLAQPGYITNFIITNGCSDLFSLKEEYNITQNNLLQTIAFFPKEYEIRFEACLSSFISGSLQDPSSNLLFMIDKFSNEVVRIWFYPKGEMKISAKINSSSYSYKTKPFELGCKKYKISQTLYHGHYIFSIKVDDIVLTRVKNDGPLELTNVKLYISDPWFKAQPGFIRNLIIRKGCYECNWFYKPLMNATYEGEIYENVIDINFAINYNDPIQFAVQVSWEYFLPPFIAVQSEYSSVGVVKIDSNNLKYKILNLTYIGVQQNITVIINNKRCLFGGSYTIDIPMKLYFTNVEGKSWESFKTIRKDFNENCTTDIVPINPNHVSEYYGRGIYWDDASSQLYLCINQYVTTIQKPACFASKDGVVLWKAMDLRVGAIIGHHTFSKELYAIHRNQKLYLMFHNVYKKWLAVTNLEFETKVSSNIIWTRLKTIKDNIDQAVTFGTNQWIVNDEGLFFRKLGDSLWMQRIKWNL